MPTIAVIGGTGPEGRGLALRFAMAGHPVVIGSRDEGRASEAAAGILEIRDGLPLTGAGNVDAAGEADWVLLSVPFEGLAATVTSLAPVMAGKLVISVVAPLTFEDGQGKAVLVPEGSAAELVRDLAPESIVTSAFQNLSSRDLLRPDHELGGDVAVCGDDDAARAQVMELASGIKSLRGVDAGSLSNSRYVEDLTALLLNINKRYKAHSTIQFLGI